METKQMIKMWSKNDQYSDPTYEAWKRGASGLIINTPSPYSDPTYEAWKLFTVLPSTPTYIPFRSYL